MQDRCEIDDACGCNGQRLRLGFTLVELLIAIAIIGVIIGMVLYTLAGAQRDALNAKTEGTIKKLNEIILFRWEEFRYRSLKINLPQDSLETFVSSGQKHTKLSPREGARLRMLVLRDTMRMEFPDRYSDILYTPTIYPTVLNTSDADPSNDFAVTMAREVPGAYNNFRRRFVTSGALANPCSLAIGQAGALVGIPGAKVTPISLENQGAELLYQIVASTNFEGSNGLEYFRPNEIGDVDEDGMPEFLDGWGKPIRWLRWPAGYGYVNSSLFPPEYANYIESSRSPDYLMNDKSVPDPMDPLRTDWRWWGEFPAPDKFVGQRPWLLVPLIVSAGADGQFDLQFDESSALAYADDTWPGPTTSTRHFNPNYPWIDPYRGYYNNSTGAIDQGGLGQWLDEDSTLSTFGTADNITNYALILQ